MGFEPRTQDGIYTSLRDRLTGNIPSLTNFTETSFNWVWTQGFSSEFREAELDKTAVYLSGLIDFAGGPIDEDDLRNLGINDVATAEELNERLDDVALDELVKIVGVDRDPGEEATGKVTFTTQSASTTIPADTSVGTQPDANGDFFEFTTDEQVSTGSGETTVTVGVTAVDVGTGYNVGSGTITYLPNPPSGVQEVTNNGATTGGEDRESNDELRERAKDAIFTTSGGGTVEGINGYIETNVDGVTDVEIEEFFTGDSWHGSYPHGHVIVSGGDRADILQAIDESRPVSVEHVLVRPQLYNIAADITLLGEGIDTNDVSSRVEEYLNGLGLGDNVIYNKIIQQTLNADDNISDIDTLDLSVEDEITLFNTEEIDDFENNDITILNRNFSGWNGDTANFSAQSSTVISGSYSGELTSANESVAVNTESSTERNCDDGLEVSIQIDAQTGNASDVAAYTVYSDSTLIYSLEFQGNGDIVFSGASDTTVGSWTAGTQYDISFQSCFVSDETDVTINGSTTNNLAHANDTTGFNTVEVSNDTTASGSTVNMYVDDFFAVRTRYPMGLGSEMLDDGITEVNGTLNGASVAFTEDTDYREFASGSTDDTLEWILAGDNPDLVERSVTLTFDENQSEYRIDDALTDEGIFRVTDAGGTVYDEATDWEEFDDTNDNRDDSIRWLGNSQPSDGTEFTVEYTASTQAFVDYDILDEDITIDIDERVDAGIITVTVL